MSPRILAVRSALPDNLYLQAELTEAFASRGRMSPAERSLLERLHAAAEVKTRHTALPLEEYSALQGAEAVNDRYIGEATAARRAGAARRARRRRAVAAADLDLLIVTSVTGVAVPSIDARLIPRLGLRAGHQAAAHLRAGLHRRRGRARAAARLPARLARADRSAACGRAVLAELADLGGHHRPTWWRPGCSATARSPSSPAAGRTGDAVTGRNGVAALRGTAR